MSTLEELAARALARAASQPIIDFDGRWITWGEMRQVAERMSALIDASGSPSSRTIRMIHPFQSAVAMARDIERLRPSVLVAASEDFTEEVRSALRTVGIAAVALSDMGATTVPGFEKCGFRDIEMPDEPRIEILTSGTTGPPKHFAVSFETIARHHVGVQFLNSSHTDDPLLMPPMLLFFPLGNITGI